MNDLLLTSFTSSQFLGLLLIIVVPIIVFVLWYMRMKKNKDNKND